MDRNEPYLIIDLDDNKIIFFVITFKDNKDYKIIKNINIDSKGINGGKITDINFLSSLIKKTVNTIEDDLNFSFSNISVVINPINVNCLNISGYKKLNGSQVFKEDVTYILNDIKKSITTNEDKYSLIHLFNSSFSLDSDNLENLPIGLFGEFYNQNMTFFLVKKNILKNIKLAISNSGLNVERVILKPFAEGINFLLNNSTKKNFSVISLEKETLKISLFKNKSFIFTEDFNFGIDFIIKDVSKLCSLTLDEVKYLLKEINLKSHLENNSESYLDNKYFSLSPYRKIKLKLIFDIITARLDEFIEICYEKNSNLNYFRKNNDLIYIIVDKAKYFTNIKFSLENNKFISPKFIFSKDLDKNLLFSLKGAAELIDKGWENEAIPVIQSKKSPISSFFSKLFS